MHSFFQCITLSALLFIPSHASTVVVDTIYGSVKGAIDGDVSSFIGIPYAKPPIGNLRFAPPEEHDTWEGTLDVSDASNTAWCIQSDVFVTGETSEDCLYLNVFTPSDAAHEHTSYQVMVWIHGGRFITGSKDMSAYDPRHWIQENGNLIVVTVNYRLGALGFMYDNDHATGVEGNFGFQDQAMAIKWVHDNIVYFGGDPTNINIFGESAGANSVALHLLYNNDYITSGIMQSPVFFMLEREPDSWSGAATDFSRFIGCDTTLNATEILDCWRSVESSDIIKAQLVDFPIEFQWSATTETEQVPRHSFTEFARSDLDIPPFIIGTNKDETWFFLHESMIGSPLDSYHGALGMTNAAVHDLTLSAAILEQYNVTLDHPGSTNYVHDVLDMINDVWICHIRAMLGTLTSKESVYYYNLDAVNEESHKLFFGQWGDLFPQCSNRVCHLTDILYLFMNEVMAQNVDDETLELSRSMRNYWFNFAKYHDPNKGVPVDVQWPGIVEENNIMVLDERKEAIAISTDRAEICAFFNSIGYMEPCDWKVPGLALNTTGDSECEVSTSECDNKEMQ